MLPSCLYDPGTGKIRVLIRLLFALALQKHGKLSFHSDWPATESSLA